MVALNTQPLEGTDQALAFLYQARVIQRESGKKLVGPVRLSADASDRVENFLQAMEMPCDLKITPTEYKLLVEKLFTKFEALCERRKLPALDANLSQLCYKQLVHEFNENLRLLPISPGRLVVATLHAVFPLHIAFNTPPLSDFLSENPWLLHRSLTSNPADPVRYLLSGYQLFVEIGDILKSNGKHVSRETHMRLAVAAQGGGCRERLQYYFHEVRELGNDPQFKDFFAKARWVIEHAVSRHGSKARSYLSSIKASVESMLADERFSGIYHQPGTLFAAAIRKPHDTATFMLSVLAQEARIKELALKTNVPVSAKEIRDLCLRTPREAERMEERLLQISGCAK